MGNAGQLVLWITVLIAACVVGWIAASFISRVVRKRVMTDASAQPFTLQSLRDMRAEGSITEAEFQSMRAAMIEQARRVPEPEPKPKPTPRPPSDDFPEMFDPHA